MITIPPTAALGTHYLCMLVDTTQAVQEFVETNNTTYQEITVLEPDLFADGFEGGDVTDWSAHSP